MEKTLKGIILAGGTGSRLFPITSSVNKQLLPVFDKPLVYYALAKLLECGIREICLVSTPSNLAEFQRLLMPFKTLGIVLEYITQESPKGIPEAFSICENFIQNDDVCLILGDNIFADNGQIKSVFSEFSGGARALGISVDNPSKYGVVEIDRIGKIINIVEKPTDPPSKIAIPGFYIFDNSVVHHAKSLKTSGRGELEIVDLLKKYLRDDRLEIFQMKNSCTWFDAGTPKSLLDASNFIAKEQENCKTVVGSPEFEALSNGMLSLEDLLAHTNNLPSCAYKEKLLAICKSR